MLKFSNKFVYIILTFLICIVFHINLSFVNAYTPSTTVEGINAFPEEYQDKLNELAKEHSNWKFVAVYTYLDWDDVVENEMVNGRSLVSTTLSSLWKKDNIEIETGWVNASKMAVEYTLDPRNFLTEDKIFQFELTTFNENAHTKEVTEQVLKGTDMYQNSEYKNNNEIKDMGTTYSEIIYNASKSKGVSASHIASRIIQENGGNIYTNKAINGSTSGYEGYYNFMNIGAYCTDGCGKPYIHGLQYSKEKGWTTPKKAIEGAADRIKNVWINYGQNTIYFEKWDVNYVSGALGLYSNQYMSNIMAPSIESTTMYNAYKNTNKLDSDFVFYIPVYLNMPDDYGMYVDKQSLVLGYNETQTLNAYIGQDYKMTENLTWTSSNENVATVNNEGIVTPVSKGKCTITVKTTDGTKLSATCDVTVNMLPFIDITYGKWYYDAIEYCYNNKIILGTSDTTFEPNKNLTRGMLVTILYRMEGSPKVTTANKFSDVTKGKYYYNAVVWAEQNGIVNGYKGTTKFGPNDNIKRQDLAGMLSNYSNYKGKYAKSSYDLSSFSDSSSVSNYALSSMKWAVENKVINGSNGKLNPKGTATRAEAAAMLYNYCLNIK